MLTIAYLGNGKSTNRYHLPFSTKLQDKIKVKTIYSPSGKLTWPTLEGVHYTSDLEDIYRDPEIQLVVVTIPSHLHYELGKDVLLHGKNVLIENLLRKLRHKQRNCSHWRRRKACLCNAIKIAALIPIFDYAKSDRKRRARDLLEVEMHYDYFRPEIPRSVTKFSLNTSYLYGHACHTLDQVISYFGQPDDVHYEVRQLLGKIA